MGFEEIEEEKEQPEYPQIVQERGEEYLEKFNATQQIEPRDMIILTELAELRMDLEQHKKAVLYLYAGSIIAILILLWFLFQK